MKIALVSRYYNKHQGIPHDVVELAERFVKKHEVHVFSQTWQCGGGTNIIFHKIPAIAPKSFINELFFFFMAGIILRKHKFDVVNFHDPCWYPGGIFTCHAFPEAGIKIIKEFNKKINMGINPLLFLPFTLLYPISNFNMKSSKVKKIISVSSFIKEKIKEILHRSENTIEVIPNGIDIARFNPGIKRIYKSDIMKKHNLKDSDFIILFVGYYHLRKGLHLLIQAMSLIKNKNAKVLVVGDDDFGKKYIHSIIREHGLENRIIYAGDQPEVYRYFSVGNLLALPTLYEPFGNVVLEAMACGLPAIVSKLAGVSDLIEDGKNGFLINDPANTKEIALKIQTIMDNKNRYKQIADNACSTAQKYTWDIIAVQTLLLFEKTVSRKNK